jgi:hypothetical protein
MSTIQRRTKVVHLDYDLVESLTTQEEKYEHLPVPTGLPTHYEIIGLQHHIGCGYFAEIWSADFDEIPALQVPPTHHMMRMVPVGSDDPFLAKLISTVKKASREIGPLWYHATREEILALQS